MAEKKIKVEKRFTIECENSGGMFSSRPSRFYYQEGTLSELIKAYSYTLEVGTSWQHEKGNKKINQNPKTVNGLITNLENAVNNSASNGYAGKSFRVIEEGEERKS
jgi:hypothetical protein